jgi:hypothetical protein
MTDLHGILGLGVNQKTLGERIERWGKIIAEAHPNLASASSPASHIFVNDPGSVRRVP